ncbi:MAG: DUF2256 domain-containing protein [Betaproteobacteria bacterium]|nr:DUF2256 domain-containing protein [Betaproteobacteria bacterium]
MTSSRHHHKAADRAGGFRGNKANLPSKPCTVCGRPMAWRKAWAKNWDDVKVCSEACRAQGARDRRAAGR